MASRRAGAGAGAGAEDAGKRKRESADVSAAADADAGSDTGDAESAESALLALAGLGGGDKRRKWTRVLLRELYDLGYSAAAAALEREAHVQLRSEAVRRLQTRVAARDWDRALRLVGYRGHAGSDDEKEEDEEEEEIVRMRSKGAARDAAFMLLRCKFLDQLARKQLRAALLTLHDEILPTFPMSDKEKNGLAMLLLCRDEKDAARISTVPWQESDILARVEQLASPDEIIPRGALGLSGACAAILLRHSSEVLDLKFSPDGAFMASSARDGQIIVWKMVFGDAGQVKIPKALHVFRSVHGAAECLAWSPDSQSLLTCGSENRTIQLWSISLGKCRHEFHHPADNVTSVQWLPSGRQFLSGTAEKSLLLWNVADGSVAYQWGGRRILDMAMHPDGKRVFVLISSVEIRVYDVEAKSDELFFKAEELVSCISLSPSGKYMLVNLIREQELVCLEIDAEVIVGRYSGLVEQRYVLRPCFSGQDSEIVVSGSEDAKIYLWHRDDEMLAMTFSGHASVINTVQSHPVRPDVLASASDDETIRIWVVRSDEQRHRRRHEDSIAPCPPHAHGGYKLPL